MDISESSPAQADSCRHIAQAAFHQNHVCRVNRHIRSCPDGNSDIRPGESRGVIDSIAYHGHLPLFSELSDHSLLAVRKDSGNYLVHSGLSADGFRRPLIVSGQHDDTDSHILKLLHRLRAVLLDNISHCDDPRKDPVCRK